MDLAQLKHIIDHGDFEQGYPCFMKHSSNNFLKDVSKSDPMLWKARILSELSKMYGQLKDEAPPEDVDHSVAITETLEVGKAEPIIPQGDVEQQLKYDAGQLFKQMKTARLGIFDTSKAKRRAAAFKVIEFQKQNKAVWADLEFYRSHGYLPGGKPEGIYSAMSAGELIHQIKLDENYLYKFAKNTGKQEELEARKLRLHDLNKELECR